MVLQPWQIPGCQLDAESNNSPFEQLKERETVQVRLRSLATCEATAELYSYIVYPDAHKAKERAKFGIALARWAVLERARLDKDWAESSDMKPSIRPIVFSQSDKDFQRIYTRDSKTLYHRQLLSCMMLFPHVFEADEIVDLPPTVGNIALGVARKLGYSDDSQKTIESKVWAPVKPVLHLAAAAMNVMGSFDITREMWNDGQHPLCFQQPMLAALFYEDIAQLILVIAEILRVQLPSCTRFKIRAEDTIRFAPDRALTPSV